jgi:hypothetical protein
MVLIFRKFLAVISGCGLAAAIAIYIASFNGSTLDDLFRWAIFLHIGVFMLLLAMYAADYSAFKSRVFFWKEFGRGMPKWVVPTIKWLGAFFVIHFIVFLWQSHAASPEMKDGNYVLNNHGHILRMLTKSEYLRLKAGELRLFATGWIFFYFVPTAYWWFRRPINKAS